MHSRLRNYETDEGYAVIALEDGSFEIVQLGVTAP